MAKVLLLKLAVASGLNAEGGSQNFAILVQGTHILNYINLIIYLKQVITKLNTF